MESMFQTAGRTAMLGACLTAAAFVGCKSQDNKPMNDRPMNDRPMTDGDAKKPMMNMGSRSQASVAFPTGQKDSSVLLITKSVPEQVSAGQPFQYTITATNLTDDVVLNNVVVHDEVTGGQMMMNEGDGMGGGDAGMMRDGNGRRGAGMNNDAMLAGRDVNMANDGDEGEPANGPGTEAAIETDDNADPDGVPRGARVGPKPDRMMENDRGNDRMKNMSMMNAKTLDAGQAQAGGQVDFGTLMPNQSKTKTVSGSASAAGLMRVCTRVDYQPQACSLINVINPEIQLVQTLQQDRILACEPINLTYRLSNSGTGTARGVRFQVELPEGLRTQSGARGVQSKPYDLQQGASSQPIPLSIMAEGPGEYKISGTAMYGDQTVETDEVTIVVVKPELEVTLDAPETEYAASTFPTTATVKNTGDGVARNLVVRQTMTGGVSLREADNNGQQEGGGVVWNLPPLEPGQTVTLKAQLAGNAVGNATTSVTANAFCADAATAQGAIDLQGIPALLIEVTDTNHDPIAVGRNGQYQIVVTNQGSKADTNVKIEATLQPGMEYTDSTATGGREPDISGQTLIYNLGDIRPGASSTIILNTKVVEATGDSRFRVQMTSDELKDKPVVEEESTRLY